MSEINNPLYDENAVEITLHKEQLAKQHDGKIVSAVSPDDNVTPLKMYSARSLVWEGELGLPSGADLIGVSGIGSIIPTGGSPGDAGSLQDMLEGMAALLTGGAGTIDGTGTANTIVKFYDADTIVNSIMTEIGANTISVAGKLAATTLGIASDALTVNGSGNLVTSGTGQFSGMTIATLSGILKASAGVVSGSATTSDLPEGSALYYTDERVDDRINALFVEGTRITFSYSDVGNTFTINTTAENNTASNVGSGLGLFKTKSTFDLQFRSLTATSSKITLTSNTNDVGIDVNESNLTISNMAGTLAVDHGGSGATTLTGLLVGNGTSAFTAVAAPSSTVVGISDTQTLTNKTLGTGSKILLGSDATGDIYYNSGSGTLARLGIGSEGEVLQVIGGVLDWGAGGAGSITGAENYGDAGVGIFKDETGGSLRFFNIASGRGVSVVMASGSGSPTEDYLVLNVDESDFVLEDMGGLLTETQGGTNQSSYTVGDILYADGTNSLAKLAGNVTVTRNFLRQKGDSTDAEAPAWDTIAAGDVPNLESLNGTLIVTKGGTGLSSLAAFDILFASATNTMSALGANTTTTKKFLRMTGTGSGGATPAWDTLVAADIPALSALSGTLGVAQGGTNLTSYTLGDLLYASNTTVISKLNGNITTTKKFLNQTGDSVNSAAPSWNALVAADIPALSALSGTLGATQGGTGQSTITRGDILYGSAANTISKLAIGANTFVLTSDGTDVSWQAPSGGGGGVSAATVWASVLAFL